VQALVALPQAHGKGDDGECDYRRNPLPPEGTARPAAPYRSRSRHPARLVSDSAHQPFFAAGRRLGTDSGQAEHSQIAAQGLQLAPARGAGFEMLLEFLALAALQLVECVERQLIRELFVRPHLS